MQKIIIFYILVFFTLSSHFTLADNTSLTPSNEANLTKVNYKGRITQVALSILKFASNLTPENINFDAEKVKLEIAVLARDIEKIHQKMYQGIALDLNINELQDKNLKLIKKYKQLLIYKKIDFVTFNQKYVSRNGETINIKALKILPNQSQRLNNLFQGFSLLPEKVVDWAGLSISPAYTVLRNVYGLFSADIFLVYPSINTIGSFRMDHITSHEYVHALIYRDIANGIWNIFDVRYKGSMFAVEGILSHHQLDDEPSIYKMQEVPAYLTSLLWIARAVNSKIISHEQGINEVSGVYHRVVGYLENTPGVISKALKDLDESILADDFALAVDLIGPSNQPSFYIIYRDIWWVPLIADDYTNSIDLQEYMSEALEIDRGTFIMRGLDLPTVSKSFAGKVHYALKALNTNIEVAFSLFHKYNLSYAHTTNLDWQNLEFDTGEVIRLILDQNTGVQGPLPLTQILSCKDVLK